MNEIYCGDIREIAKTLPDQSVNCIVTSPPYFGLRDYQTAKWEGGKAECDHSPVRQNPTNGSTLDGGKSTTGHAKEAYKSYCPKCGAKRIDKQIGIEESPEDYVNTLVGIFRELKRVLRDDGTAWLNLGDSYAGNNSSNGEGETRNLKTELFHDGAAHLQQRRIIANCSLKPKNLIGIPWRVAFALQADGWILRSDIIWHKKNPMPESVTDRPTKAHEYIFLLSKKPRYYYDNEAVREAHKRLWDENNIGEQNMSTTGIAEGKILGRKIMPNNGLVNALPNPSGRNRRSVWSVSTRPYKHAHFAVFPPDLIRPCILAGCPQQVCAECGKPWARVVEKGKILSTGGSKSGARATNLQTISPNGQTPDNAFNTGNFVARERITLGWQPACNCNADTKPGVVFDPFMGSGTVAQVAIETGRNWLGVELNPEYIELANKRIAQTQPPLPIEAVL